MDIKNKVFVVTGSARGLGAAIVNAVLQRGAKVCMCDIRENLGQQTCTEFAKKYGNERVKFVPCDVRNDDQIRGVFKTAKETYGGIDVVVNNAAILNEGRWEDCIDINVKGVIRGTVIALEYMRTDRGGNGGTILNMGSISAYDAKEHAMMPTYSASKHAVVGFTKSIAENPDVRNNGVRVISLCPGTIGTAFIELTTDMIFGNFDIFTRYMGSKPYLSAEQAADGFMKILTDIDNSGGCLRYEDIGPEIMCKYV